MAVFFLPLVLAGLAPLSEYKNALFKMSATRFSWSRLTPFKLKNRSVGLSTESNAQGKVYFTLDGHKFMIVGGSIHYFRVPREYWKDRLLKLQACGFNTVTTYIPWNLHEQNRGTFDFSEILDLEAYVSLAATLGLWVILRPGPYICAEVDLGGLPSDRTLVLLGYAFRLALLLRGSESKTKFSFKLRLCYNQVVYRRSLSFGCGSPGEANYSVNGLVAWPFPSPVTRYLRGGPVIAVQIENEYGSFSKDGDYMEYIKEALQKRGIVELLLTSDNHKGIQTGSVKGVFQRHPSFSTALTTINMASFEKDSFIKLLQMQNDKPIMVMEYWTGWFDTWGREHNVKSAEEIRYTVSRFIKYGISFNMYMFHGGTNFGFINGAFHYDKHSSVVTSYVMGMFRERNIHFIGFLPRLPQLIPKTVYPTVGLAFYLPLFDILPYLNKPVMLYTPVTMENLPINNGSGQPFGFVLYETSICAGGDLYASVSDSAQVFLNDTTIGNLDEYTYDLTIPTIQDCQLLRILVENQGRINYSWKIQNEWKGLNGDISINGTLLKNFTIYSLDMKMSFFERLRSATWRLAPENYLGPAFYLGTLKADSSPKDTFLDLSNWYYGFVFINGRNLGRYQNIGPQRTLYLPGPWLHPGDNEIIVFEKIQKGFYIQSKTRPQLQY
uniref:Beta-galactosidase n=1 Tax=Cricetulus griseus TaxID=10029 RepID=A0A8C2LSW8_CRIGR